MNLILNGYNGFMCKEIVKLAKNPDNDITIITGVSRSGNNNNAECPFFKTFAEIEKQNRSSIINNTDCIIDFSHHDTTDDMTNFATANKIPMVIATTGHTKKDADQIIKAAIEVPVFYTSNYSIGIALLVEHAKKIAKSFGDNADIEIVEVHHNRKADAPSGTALTIANEIQSVLPERNIHTGRSGMQPRQPSEIGINSVRMGNIVGTHSVHICNNNECITLKHEAFSRSLFAEGAIKAAKFLVEQKPGLYNMDSLIASK